MIYVGIVAVIAMPLLKYVRPAGVAFTVPMLLLAWYAWSPSTISALGVWLASGITVAVLWRDQRG